MSVSDRVAAGAGSLSGVASVMGSWQICHSLCLALITALGVIGITVTGMPLLFLNTIAVPVWIVAVALLVLTVAINAKKHCISNGLIVLNAGLITAGFPFWPQLSVLYWSVGGAVALSGIFLLVRARRQRRSCHG